MLKKIDAATRFMVLSLPSVLHRRRLVPGRSKHTLESGGFRLFA